MAPRSPSRRLRSDEVGQMMMLSAIVLLIGFVALAGMVSRVNQLGGQTGTESRQAILDEAGPLADSITTGVASLSAGCSFATGKTTSASTTAESTVATTCFASTAVGKSISGAGIPPGARITAFTDTQHVTISPAATATQASGVSISVGGFGLTTSSAARDAAVATMLEQMQVVEKGHGLFMDWTCAAGGGLRVHLTDGTVWIEMRPATPYTCFAAQSG